MVHGGADNRERGGISPLNSRATRQIPDALHRPSHATLLYPTFWCPRTSWQGGRRQTAGHGLGSRQSAVGSRQPAARAEAENPDLDPDLDPRPRPRPLTRCPRSKIHVGVELQSLHIPATQRHIFFIFHHTSCIMQGQS